MTAVTGLYNYGFRDYRPQALKMQYEEKTDAPYLYFGINYFPHQ